jgi:hypothetical protein
MIERHKVPWLCLDPDYPRAARVPRAMLDDEFHCSSIGFIVANVFWVAMYASRPSIISPCGFCRHQLVATPRSSQVPDGLHYVNDAADSAMAGAINIDRRQVSRDNALASFNR